MRIVINSGGDHRTKQRKNMVACVGRMGRGVSICTNTDSEGASKKLSVSWWTSAADEHGRDGKADSLFWASFRILRREWT